MQAGGVMRLFNRKYSCYIVGEGSFIGDVKIPQSESQRADNDTAEPAREDPSDDEIIKRDGKYGSKADENYMVMSHHYCLWTSSLQEEASRAGQRPLHLS